MPANLFVILFLFLASNVTGIPENFQKFNLNLTGPAADLYNHFIGTYVLVNDILLRGREVWEHIYDDGNTGNRERHVVGLLTYIYKVNKNQLFVYFFFQLQFCDGVKPRPYLCDNQVAFDNRWIIKKCWEQDADFCKNTDPKLPQIRSGKQKKGENSEYWPHQIKKWQYFDTSDPSEWDDLIINETIIFNLTTG